MTFLYVDTHCHLDQYAKPHIVAQAAAHDRVQAVAVTELPSTYRRFKSHLGRPEGVHFALGFHPLVLSGSGSREKVLFAQTLPMCDFVGEIGLDYAKSSLDRPKQREILGWILDMEDIDRKVLSVHSRGAEKDVITALSGTKANAILHWYTGPSALVEKALEAGLYFSVNASMLRTKRGRRLIEMIPRNQILTETDGPYGYVGRYPATPSSVPGIVESIASAWCVPHCHARSIIWENWTALLRKATVVNHMREFI